MKKLESGTYIAPFMYNTYHSKVAFELGENIYRNCGHRPFSGRVTVSLRSVDAMRYPLEYAMVDWLGKGYEEA